MGKSNTKKKKRREALINVVASVGENQKSATHSETVSAKKTPVYTEQPDRYLDMTPVWLFKFGDFQHAKWGLHKKECYEFLKTLSDLEGQTWKEIMFSNSGKAVGTRNHFINVAKITKEAQKRLEELNIVDIDSILSLRITGEKRLWGILRNEKFHILWYDRKHEICPSTLRHT